MPTQNHGHGRINSIGRRVWAGIAALVVLASCSGGAVALAATTTPTSVTCPISGGSMTCPLPTITSTVTATAAASTATKTTTATVRSTSTVTATVTVTASAAPASTSTPAPPSTTTAASTSSSTSSPTSTTAAATSTAAAAGALPGASNTGVPAGTTLTPSGSIVVTTPNAVISGLDITGDVTIQASGVVIKNSRIRGGGSVAYCIYTASGSVTIQDSEITGGCENAIGFDNWTAYRVNIHGTYGDGVKLGSNVLLQDSWIHDLAPAAGAHSDGGQIQDGVVNTTVRHNRIDLSTTANGNSALFIAPDLGPSSNGPVTVDANYLDGGNYTVYCVDGNNGAYFIKTISFTGNQFGRHAGFGPSDVNVPITQSGNTWADTGAPLAL